MSTNQLPQSNDVKSIWPRWLRPFALENSRLQWWIVLFILVSIGDLMMTYFLLDLNANFYESNPIANWFFTHWNIAGMTFFKFAVVAFVIVISEIVERKRCGAGKFVLIFGVLVTAYVVYYSYTLYQGYKSGLITG